MVQESSDGSNTEFLATHAGDVKSVPDFWLLLGTILAAVVIWILKQWLGS